MSDFYGGSGDILINQGISGMRENSRAKAEIEARKKASMDGVDSASQISSNGRSPAIAPSAGESTANTAGDIAVSGGISSANPYLIAAGGAMKVIGAKKTRERQDRQAQFEYKQSVAKEQRQSLDGLMNVAKSLKAL